MDMKQALFIKKMMRLTCGQLEKETYAELYRLAEEASEGVILEIGTAQGAATIMLALGAKNNPNIKRVITVDAFGNSAALKHRNNVQANVNEVKKNLAAYGCDDSVDILVAGREDLSSIKDQKISLMLIDADGGLDRDICRYYDYLSPDAVVVVDDCRLKLNRHAVNHNTRERTGYNEDILVDARNYLNHPAPLGKDHIVWNFVDYLIKEGLFVKVKDIDKTVVLKKNSTVEKLDDRSVKELEKIRQNEKDEFLQYRKKTMKITSELDPLVKKIQAECGGGDVVVLKRLHYIRNSEYYPIWGASGSDNGEMIGNGKISDRSLKQRLKLRIRNSIRYNKKPFVFRMIKKPFVTDPRFLVLVEDKSGAGTTKIPGDLIKELYRELYAEEDKISELFGI